MTFKQTILTESQMRKCAIALSNKISSLTKGQDLVLVARCARARILALDIAKTIKMLEDKPVMVVDFDRVDNDFVVSNKTTIILVEDVFYTGRSASDCVDKLRNAKAARVELASFICTNKNDLPYDYHHVAMRIELGAGEIVALSVKPVDVKNAVEIYSL